MHLGSRYGQTKDTVWGWRPGIRLSSDEVPCGAQLLQNHFLPRPQTLRDPCPALALPG